jgi:hypothetical protein
VAADNTDFEFIEIQNVGSSSRPMEGVHFSDGITFAFGATSLAAGARAVLVRNPAAFAERYGAAIAVAGTFTGLLSDAGETITLRDAANAVIQSFTYVDTWASASDGIGHSLVVRDPNQPLGNFDLPAGWHASSRIGGSPGAADVGVYPGAIVVNEILAHQDVAPGDWVELHNTSTAAVNIGGWYLSDKPNQPNLYQFPPNVMLAAGAFLAVTQQFHFGVGQNAFAFSELGDDVVLTAPLGPGGEIYGDRWQFGATDNGVTLGRYVASTGVADLAVASQPTRGAANTAPNVGPIVVSEIMYNPATSEEFIELHNPTNQPVQLFDPANPENTWRFTQGITFALPQNTTIPAGGYLLLVDDDPASFRADNNVPANVPVLSFSGATPDSTLSNAGEAVELSRPGVPEPPGSENPGFVPYYTVDRFVYDDAAPWPTMADGGGPSLLRKAPLTFGNDPANWQAGVVNGSPGRPDADLIGPRVTSVRLGGALWSGGDVAISVGDAEQLQPFPYSRIDWIIITFDEPVTISETSLTVSGANAPFYEAFPDNGIGVASTAITWTMAAPLPADRFLLDLENEQVFDVAGNRLDGEWTDAASVFPSGDGVRGGDFRFSFSVLPGDVNQDGNVTMTDVALAREHAFSSVGSGEFNPLADIDRNGRINVVDMVRIRNALGTSLPPPPAPSAASAMLAAAELRSVPMQTSPAERAPIVMHATRRTPTRQSSQAAPPDAAPLSAASSTARRLRRDRDPRTGRSLGESSGRFVSRVDSNALPDSALDQ